MIKQYPSIVGFEQFVELKDYKAPTKKHYLRQAEQCAEHFGCDPATLQEDQVRKYFLFLRQERELGTSSMRVARYALCAFFRQHLKQGLDWTVFEDLRCVRDQTLPLVLSHEEVGQVLAPLREARFRTCARLIYHTGLRVGEAVSLRVQDLRDSHGEHPQIHVRAGKGGRDRYVPLSRGMVQELRVWWRQHRHPTFLFPSPGRGERATGNSLGKIMGKAIKPMSKASLQHAFHLALQISPVNKPATLHTLRHSYATRLLEHGISIRQIAHYLGHKRLETTLIYTHLTVVSEARTHAALKRLYEQLGS